MSRTRNAARDETRYEARDETRDKAKDETRDKTCDETGEEARDEARDDTRYTRHETTLETRHTAKHELLDIPEMILAFSRRMLGGCSEFTRDSDAKRILLLDSSGCSNLERHSDETFVLTGWTLHEGFSCRAICTMEL